MLVKNYLDGFVLYWQPEANIKYYKKKLKMTINTIKK